jgi:hypothetical protein
MKRIERDFAVVVWASTKAKLSNNLKGKASCEEE